ncbi:DUF4376 domain-containing protein [uncultured Marinobacter sp.]|uniref:DUF4376 domain-containing protein n=1 Tax=uncultured Marinobacter sp. TaxID=187379 RepID=UPI002598C9E4|nr:DUF4376 domain-containing protein [uncultured Marinobacter sp.]
MKRSLQLNPDNRPATWAQVRDWRDTHEVAPVETSQGTFDCDDRSDKRLYEQLGMFDYLDTLNPDGTLSWKRADNTWVALSKQQLADLYQEIRINRAKRAGVLHVKAAEFEALEVKPLVKELQVLNFWLK